MVCGSRLVADGLRGFFFFFFLIFFFLWFVGCGFCDQRRARMVVTGLGGVTGFFVGLGMKSSCGATGYTRIWFFYWFGSVRDLIGQILER